MTTDDDMIDIKGTCKICFKSDGFCSRFFFNRENFSALRLFKKKNSFARLRSCFVCEMEFFQRLGGLELGRKCGAFFRKALQK